MTIRAKILIQELWKGGFDWDEPVPANYGTTWINLAKNIQQATQINIPRLYFQRKASHHSYYVFTDASLTSYGSAAYITNGIDTALVMAKTRVAPLKTLTLPQLELMGAVIGSRLANHVCSALE